MIHYFCYFLIMNPDFLLLQQTTRQLGLELHEQQLAQFELYQNELRKWNNKTNLIADSSSGEIIVRHFLDSLTAVQFIEQQNDRIVDIGCGAGFPGIPLKIALPSLQLYLLEANRKKTSFLKHIVRLLHLSNTFVIHERAETLLKDGKWNHFFTAVISRATFKLPEILPLASFFLQPGGKLIALKSKDIDEEFLQGSEAAPRYGFNQLFQYDINKIFLGRPRKIIVGEKIK
jgi:16S rRNA (guanine527-N7)-methyltransferase